MLHPSKTTQSSRKTHFLKVTELVGFTAGIYETQASIDRFVYVHYNLYAWCYHFTTDEHKWLNWDLSFALILTLMAFIVITAAHCSAIMQDLKVGLEPQTILGTKPQNTPAHLSVSCLPCLLYVKGSSSLKPPDRKHHSPLHLNRLLKKCHL